MSPIKPPAEIRHEPERGSEAQTAQGDSGMSTGGHKPDRFKGIAGINPSRIVPWLAHLETAVREHGFVGTHLYPHWPVIGFERAMREIEELGFSGDVRQKLPWRNAVRVYGLEDWVAPEASNGTSRQGRESDQDE